jgi:hypothetical protein
MNAAALNTLINDAVRMMGYAGISEEDAHEKIRAAVLDVMLTEIARVNEPRRSSWSSVDMPPRADPARAALASDPIVTAAPAIVTPPGKYFKGSGRKVPGPEGTLIELGTWVNPAGDIEAQRLTKETGVLHLVDPNTGEVVSTADIADLAARSEVVAETGPLKTMGAVQADVAKPV